MAAGWWVVGSVSRGLGAFGRRRRGDRKSTVAPARIERSATVKYVDPPGWASPAPQTLPSTNQAPRIGDVLVLTPGQFENLTAALLTRIGYTGVQRTGGSGDLGAHSVCRDPQGRTTIVQCKRHAPGSTIGTPVVQTFIGMMAHAPPGRPRPDRLHRRLHSARGRACPAPRRRAHRWRLPPALAPSHQNADWSPVSDGLRRKPAT